MTKNRLFTACIIIFVLFFAPSFSRQEAQPLEKADVGVLNRIWDEGVNRSQIMDTLSYLTDVFGPRLAGHEKSVRMDGGQVQGVGNGQRGRRAGGRIRAGLVE